MRRWLGVTITLGGARARAGRRRLISLPPYQPFPTKALPPVLREYAEASAEAAGRDPALVALPAVAAAAGAVGDSRALRLRRGWAEPARVRAATVAGVPWCVTRQGPTGHLRGSLIGRLRSSGRGRSGRRAEAGAPPPSVD